MNGRIIEFRELLRKTKDLEGLRDRKLKNKLLSLTRPDRIYTQTTSLDNNNNTQLVTPITQ